MLFSRSVVSNSFAAPWTVARQAPLSMGFSRQEYWSGLLCPPPGDLPDPGIEPMSLELADSSLLNCLTSSRCSVNIWRNEREAVRMLFLFLVLLSPRCLFKQKAEGCLKNKLC